MIELVVLGATLAIAAGASGAQARRRVLAARTLERYAKWRAHMFVPGKRRKQSPRVEGTKHNGMAEVAFTIDLVKIRGHVRTRVQAAVTTGPGARLAIVQRGAITRALGSRGTDELPVGIAAFDHAYTVHGMAPEEARAWLGGREGSSRGAPAPLEQGMLENLVMLDERSDVWLGSDTATVTLMWGGVEMNPLLLDAARDVVVSLASWHRPEFPYR